MSSVNMTRTRCRDCGIVRARRWFKTEAGPPCCWKCGKMGFDNLEPVAPASLPPMSASALDDFLSCHGERGWDAQAARAELESLRKRAADLELMLRWFFCTTTIAGLDRRSEILHGIYYAEDGFPETQDELTAWLITEAREALGGGANG